jgi:hypothetical protein
VTHAQQENSHEGSARNARYVTTVVGDPPTSPADRVPRLGCARAPGKARPAAVLAEELLPASTSGIDTSHTPIKVDFDDLRATLRDWFRIVLFEDRRVVGAVIGFAARGRRPRTGTLCPERYPQASPHL